jgi:arabinofuranosyltransferase
MIRETINTNYSFDLSRHQNTLLILVFAGACVGIIAHTFFGYSGDFSGRAFGSDDAFISYRYAENLINGHGIVFNPGERVEGYSNFLYVLLMTPGLYFGDDYI